MAEIDMVKDRDSLELDITYSCNMRCQQCDRACGVCPSSDVMTVKQIGRVLDESLSLLSPYQNIWVLGGEPSLHPNIVQVLDVLNEYKKQVQGCVVRFWTHGWGRRVAKVLEVLSSWVDVTNSNKKPGVNPPGFNPFLLAPLDYPYSCTNRYWRGCKWISPGRSGIGVTRHGIYVCAVAGAIDRVVGLDIGLRSLHDISHSIFQKQCEALCRYCGHFLADNGVYPTDISISKTWRRLISDYQQRAPALQLY